MLYKCFVFTEKSSAMITDDEGELHCLCRRFFAAGVPRQKIRIRVYIKLMGAHVFEADLNHNPAAPPPRNPD